MNSIKKIFDSNCTAWEPCSDLKQQHHSLVYHRSLCTDDKYFCSYHPSPPSIYLLYYTGQQYTFQVKTENKK